jgi:hypothetical protein
VHVYTSRKHHKTVPNKQASKQEITQELVTIKPASKQEIVPRACNQQASKRLYQELVPNKQASKQARDCSQQASKR